MMNFAFVIAGGVALLFFLWLVLRRNASDTAAHHDYVANPSAYWVRLPPRALLDRFLSPEDVEYAAELNSPALLRRVVRERRRLAAAWLRQTRREAGRLFLLHVRTVRQAEGLRPAAEVNLVFAAASFLVVYAVMMTAVGLYGPLHTRRFLESLQSLANILSNLGGRIAESIGPALVPQLDGRGGR
ncbi:MAG TPA: hypothetical protein VG096_02310 [Bryobacteraceae bacterium]|jgi:hypothetical protein|nr:hypothetical protein [Bryobacteraceae bacterium]